jgi:hypothetical protein
MAKMLRAHSSISQRKVESAVLELPLLCRKILIDEAGAGTTTGTGPPNGAAASGAFGARGSCMRRITTRLPYPGFLNATLIAMKNKEINHPHRGPIDRLDRPASPGCK